MYRVITPVPHRRKVGRFQKEELMLGFEKRAGTSKVRKEKKELSREGNSTKGNSLMCLGNYACGSIGGYYF